MWPGALLVKFSSMLYIAERLLPGYKDIMRTLIHAVAGYNLAETARRIIVRTFMSDGENYGF